MCSNDTTIFFSGMISKNSLSEEVTQVHYRVGKQKALPSVERASIERMGWARVRARNVFSSVRRLRSRRIDKRAALNCRFDGVADEILNEEHDAHYDASVRCRFSTSEDFHHESGSTKV